MTFPLATLAAQVTATGISAPSYSDIYASLQASYQGIFGSDSVIAPDSQDGQLLAIFAKAISDSNDVAIAIYNSLSPATAQGVALSNNVKLNGLMREASSQSTAVVTIVGVAGTTINNGVVSDSAGNRWDLPASVIIPGGGSIDETVTCEAQGAITADVNTITAITTPTLGWQTVTNAAAATPGAPVESDATLRQRQAVSTALPSLTVLDGIAAAIANLPGVTEVMPYENDTGSTDANGLPAHSIAMVVAGGDAVAICETILLKKTEGAFTYGTTRETVDDPIGIPYDIGYFVPTADRIVAIVTIHNLTGYSSGTGTALKQAVADYINALGIGVDVQIPKLYLPAQLYGAAVSSTYELVSIQIAKYPSSPGSSDVVVAFNEQATCQVSDITLTVV